MDQAVIRLRLIGPMEARTSTSENVLPSGRKARALLACIAMAMPRSVPRSRLIEQLWSRSPEEQGRASLRQEIHRVMDALSPAGTNILIVTRDHLAVRPGAILTDVQEITDASPQTPEALRLLDAELLEDLEGVDPRFDDWLRAERKQLRSRALRIAESILRGVNDLDEAVVAAERVLTIDRANEGAWRALMNVHDARGERGLAIQTYNRCRAALAHSADAMPSAKTQKLFDEIRGPSHSEVLPRSTQLVEGIALQPRLGQGTQNEPAPDKPASMTIHGTRIGVMPFRLISSPDEHAWLAPGLADEITNALARFRGMLIVSPDSLDRFAGDNRDEASVKRELGLDFLLDGAVQRGGSTIRISLQLLDLRANNRIVWARRFDRQLSDLLSLQDEIAAAVAAQIDPEILLIEAKRSTSHGPVDPTAYDLMLRAVPLIGWMDQKSFMEAGQYLADAVALEPENARLYAWYAYWHLFLVGQDWAKNPVAIREKACELAERAIVLDPLDAHGLAVSGHVQAFLHRRLRDAMVLHNRALSLNPHLAMAWALSAVTYAYAGDLEEAERRNNQYKTLSPFDPHAFFFDAFFVLIYLMKRDYETAAAVGQTLVQLNPTFSASYKPYLAALGHLRRDSEAAAIRQRLLALEPHFTIERFLENNPIERECDKMHYAEGLRLAGIPT